MIIEKIGSRGVFFTFEDGDAPIAGNTSIYLINTDERIFLCDTHLGPKSMEIVKEYINDNKLNDKRIIVFNSHSDWDHIWGNYAFEGADIIAHRLCRERMKEQGEYDLEKYKNKYHDGSIKLKLPNITFDSNLKFEDQRIEFIYTPGHTIDSAICFDRNDKVIFVGDLIEYPIPILNHYDWESYLKTLKFIKSLSIKIILTAHSGIVNEKLLDDNIAYIEKLLSNKLLDFKDEEILTIHKYNINRSLILRYEDIVRKKLREKFNYKFFKKEFWGLVDSKYDDLASEFVYIINTEYDDLKKTLENYILSL